MLQLGLLPQTVGGKPAISLIMDYAQWSTAQPLTFAFFNSQIIAPKTRIYAQTFHFRCSASIWVPIAVEASSLTAYWPQVGCESTSQHRQAGNLRHGIWRSQLHHWASIKFGTWLACKWTAERSELLRGHLHAVQTYTKLWFRSLEIFFVSTHGRESFASHLRRSLTVLACGMCDEWLCRSHILTRIDKQTTTKLSGVANKSALTEQSRNVFDDCLLWMKTGRGTSSLSKSRP